LRKALRVLWLSLAWAYVIGLGGWFVGNRLLGDRWWWLFFLNALSLYLFVPLFPLAVATPFLRQRRLWFGIAAGLGIGLYLYGGLWLPRPATAQPAGPSLTVMTFNTLGFNRCPECVVASVRASGADLVNFQELSRPVAAALARDLAQEYPYRVLAPREGTGGMGAISRLPLRDTGETLPGYWVGQPQVLALSLGATRVLVVNAHPTATLPNPVAEIERTRRERFVQAQTLVAFAQTHPGPLLFASDCNMTDQNADYRLMATIWHDSWREAGRGFGRTYPGGDQGGDGNMRFGALTLPRWIVRIDYVWHSSHWRATEARLGQWDGHSDHRPTIARLVLTVP
jgi:endonuclease/exonuclease/phosphatase (EEP) superfamily protein YafD